MILGNRQLMKSNIAITYPAYQNNGGLGTQATANANLSVALPAGISAGDILIAQVMITSSNETETPTGWTLIQTDGGTDSTFSHSTFWRRATSGETGTVTFVPITSWSGLFIGIIYRFTGCVSTGTPYESLLSTPTGTPGIGDKTISPTAPTGALRLGIVLGICEDDTIVSVTGTGWVTSSLLQTSAGTDGGMALCTKELNNGDTVEDVTIDHGSLDYSVLTSMMLLPKS